MKELTLINRYHQTQERPKPSVEQRVKVMDTLRLVFVFFNKGCALAFIVFGTLSKISLSMGSGDSDSGVGDETATGLGL
jgi:hypothetical protein